MSRLLYRLDEAAEQVSVSVQTLRRAINATDPDAYPPPLKAKNAGSDRKPSYRIPHDALVAWAESLKDA
jgi:hypothetical protein